jgi:hypothetical protein
MRPPGKADTNWARLLHTCFSRPHDTPADSSRPLRLGSRYIDQTRCISIQHRKKIYKDVVYTGKNRKHSAQLNIYVFQSRTPWQPGLGNMDGNRKHAQISKSFCSCSFAHHQPSQFTALASTLLGTPSFYLVQISNLGSMVIDRYSNLVVITPRILKCLYPVWAWKTVFKPWEKPSLSVALSTRQVQM